MARALPEPAAARDEARRCEEGEGKDDGGVAACREALRLGLREPQRTALRQLLARRLAERERFDELVELYGEDTEEHPGDSEAWRRLGAARLFLRADPASALPALEEAEKLRADLADTHVLLGLCLSSLARHEEAVAAFEAALRLDPEALALAAGGAGHPRSGAPRRALAVKASPSTRVDPALSPYLSLLDEAFERKAWHGPNLRGTLRGRHRRGGRLAPRPRTAQRLGALRPRGLLEIRGAAVAHRREARLVPLPRQQLVRPAGGAASAAAWRKDLAALGEEHRLLEGSRLPGTRARSRPAAAREQVHEGAAHPGRGRPRPVPRRPDPAPEAPSVPPSGGWTVVGVAGGSPPDGHTPGLPVGEALAVDRILARDVRSKGDLGAIG